MASERFRFGDNWRRFIANLSPEQIDEAVLGLQTAMGADRLDGRVFLDIGCGSGIHSLAAFRMGARAIVSFDFDLDSVACTQAMRERAGAPPNWRVLQGSVLDMAFLESAAPAADDVYSWGVLHHTGSMWEAIRNAARCCSPAGGRLLIGIYNEKRPGTDIMRWIKRAYVASPPLGQELIKWSYWGVTAAVQVARGRNVSAEIRGRLRERGMDYWRDLEDWVGGYPYECATPEAVRAFVEGQGFTQRAARVRNTIASVNEYLFTRN